MIATKKVINIPEFENYSHIATNTIYIDININVNDHKQTTLNESIYV